MSRAPHRLFLGKDVHKFNAAHMTVFHDGTKEALHGHNFQVAVAIDLTDVSFASFLDFGVVKDALGAQCAAWNERLILAERCPFYVERSRADGSLDFTLCGKRYVVPLDEVVFLPVENIVVETLAVELGRGLIARLGAALRRDVAVGLEVEVCESHRQGATAYLSLDQEAAR